MQTRQGSVSYEKTLSAWIWRVVAVSCRPQDVPESIDQAEEDEPPVLVTVARPDFFSNVCISAS